MGSARIVFCDFDGTITVEDTFAGAIAPLVPEAAERILPALFARQMTLREGVRELLGAVPSDRYPDILAYAAQQPIRAGFEDLLAWLEARQVPLAVVSGGIEGMVRAVLDRPGRDGRPLSDRIASIAAMSVDISGPYLQVSSAFEAGDELVAKVEVMKQYPAADRVAIGDSVTDIEMARAADLVFARDRLQGYLQTEGKPYEPWENFWQVRDRLAQYWPD